MRTIICMKWGTRYPAPYVNRLYAGVARHTAPGFRFVCYTDDAAGIRKEVEARPLPPIALPERVAWSPWRKLSVWQDGIGLQGDVLFLDLDLLVTGSLDPFFAYEPGRYCVIENFTQRGAGIGNTSCFRFRAGRHTEVYDRFEADPEAVLAAHRIEQQYISTLLAEQRFWPQGWCVSFKHDLVPPVPLNWLRAPALPPGARIVAFTGKPDIDEAARGEWPAPWYKKPYKHARPAPWAAEHWSDHA